MLPPSLFLAALSLLCLGTVSAVSVFLEKKAADRVLKVRRVRANSFLEEMYPGNLERECYEETCNFEEANEIFQTKEKTMEFWFRYRNMNPCKQNPCLNGGICSFTNQNYMCLCPPRFDGYRCETEIFECQYKNGGCQQYCTNRFRTVSVQCSCAEGYKLEDDGKHCEQAVPFPCGKKGNNFRSLLDEEDFMDDTMLSLNNTLSGNDTLSLNNTLSLNDTLSPDNVTDSPTPELPGSDNSDVRIVGGDLEVQGGSPWQVLVHRKDGYGFCGGSLITERWVVSAAHCFDGKPDHVTLGNYDKFVRNQDEQKIAVQALVVHPHYHADTYDSDIALLLLARPAMLGPYTSPICLPNGNLARLLLQDDVMGTVSGWGSTRHLGPSSRFLRKVRLPVVNQQKCMSSTAQVVTDNMFCAGYADVARDSCKGDSGGPFASLYQGTWFLTGVVSWGEECAAKGKYGVYTRVDNFLPWIQDTVASTAASLK
ncbi:coagulation factor IX isoform X2 [Amia ocellicauda]